MIPHMDIYDRVSQYVTHMIENIYVHYTYI